MNPLIVSSANPIVPSPVVLSPRVPLDVRPATPDDLPFLDELQKRHGKALGYFPTEQFKGYIQMGGVLIAESGGRRVGYVISRDRYLKRDELGVIFQLCVAPVEQRRLIGAGLVQEVFRRSAYGCRLYCCWCAQDLAANYFWESLGFVPLAFRAGSKGKRRVHIFWQKRIVDGDTETKWWYPFQTNGGAIREDRLVFPIPVGTHWKDVQAAAVPTVQVKELPDETTARPCSRRAACDAKQAPASPPVKPHLVPLGGFRFASEVPPAPQQPAKAKKPKPPAPAKIDPQFLKLNRELRDRYLEHINSGQRQLPEAGKYDVRRALEARNNAPADLPLLPAA